MQKNGFTYASGKRYETADMSAKKEFLRQEITTNSLNHNSIKMPSPTFAHKDQERKVGTNLGYVGFDSLPKQIYRKAVRRGFEFTLLVIGSSGLGKSTFINTLFLTDIYSNEYPGPSQRAKKTLQVETTKILLSEGEVNLMLTIVDTPGFGDCVDNSECWQPIITFINQRYEEYLDAESRVNRTSVPDCRVHCCLYFIAPSVYGMKPLDIEFLKQIHDKVNVVPLIGKADTMTQDECALCKRTVLCQLAQNKIKVYDFPLIDDDQENKLQKVLKQKIPFAVIGSNFMLDSLGKRGRKYPWGVAEVDNSDHCDSTTVRDLLLRTHMRDLIEVTSSVHYENFRSKKLAGVNADNKNARTSNKNPLAQMEEEKRTHDVKLKHMEDEMRQVFELKVKEKLQKLKDSEIELQKHTEQVEASLEQERKELEDKWRAFENEKKSEDKEMTLTSSNTEKKKEKKKSLF